MIFISKETFVNAEDSKNKDALLYDMLKHIDSRIDAIITLKKDVEKFKTQVSFIKKLFISAMAIFTAASVWLTKNS